MPAGNVPTGICLKPDEKTTLFHGCAYCIMKEKNAIIGRSFTEQKSMKKVVC